MGSACQETEQPGHEGRIERDTVRVSAKDLRRYLHHVVQSSGSLQCRGGGDDGHDDEHHVNRNDTGFEPEAEDEDEHAYHAVDTEADRAHFRADEDHRQHDEQLQYDQECCHCRMLFSYGPFGSVGFGDRTELGIVAEGENLFGDKDTLQVRRVETQLHVTACFRSG